MRTITAVLRSCALGGLLFVCVCDAVKAGGTVANVIVYPSFTPNEPSANPLVAPGHALFNREEDVSSWGKDVLAFLAKHVRTSP
jgi:hypothetical protein